VPEESLATSGQVSQDINQRNQVGNRKFSRPEPQVAGGVPAFSPTANRQSSIANADAVTTNSDPLDAEILGCELATQVLQSSGELRLRVTGTSMLPAIWPGDILLISSRNIAEARPGDVVLFGREGRLVAHRVVEVRSPLSEVRSRRSEARGAKLESRTYEAEDGIQRSGVACPAQSSITNRNSQIGIPGPRTPNPEAPIPALEFVTRGDSVGQNDAPVRGEELLGCVLEIQRGSRRLAPRLSWWGHAASWVLARSTLATSIVLRMSRGVRRAASACYESRGITHSSRP